MLQFQLISHLKSPSSCLVHLLKKQQNDISSNWEQKAAPKTFRTHPSFRVLAQPFRFFCLVSWVLLWSFLLVYFLTRSIPTSKPKMLFLSDSPLKICHYKRWMQICIFCNCGRVGIRSKLHAQIHIGLFFQLQFNLVSFLCILLLVSHQHQKLLITF